MRTSSIFGLIFVLFSLGTALAAQPVTVRFNEHTTAAKVAQNQFGDFHKVTEMTFTFSDGRVFRSRDINDPLWRTMPQGDYQITLQEAPAVSQPVEPTLVAPEQTAQNILTIRLRENNLILEGQIKTLESRIKTLNKKFTAILVFSLLLSVMVIYMAIYIIRLSARLQSLTLTNNLQPKKPADPPAITPVAMKEFTDPPPAAVAADKVVTIKPDKTCTPDEDILDDFTNWVKFKLNDPEKGVNNFSTWKKTIYIPGQINPTVGVDVRCLPHNAETVEKIIKKIIRSLGPEYQKIQCVREDDSQGISLFYYLPAAQPQEAAMAVVG